MATISASDQRSHPHTPGHGTTHINQQLLMTSQHLYQQQQMMQLQQMMQMQLQMQRPQQHLPSSSVQSLTSTTGAIVSVNPDGTSLDDFKNDVRTWVELDNSIRRMQAATKERRAAKSMLTERILGFMNRYNIEDLNTKDARLRYKTAYTRVPLSHQTIKERISTYFGDNNARIAQELQGHLFGNRERSEKTSLRRLKNVL